MVRIEEPRHASDELIFVTIIALVAMGSLVLIYPSDEITSEVTGSVVIADRKSTIPENYAYQGALQHGKLPAKSGSCEVCTSGTLRPGMFQVFPLCTGDYSVRLNMVSSLKGNVLFDVNGELFDVPDGERVTLRDGMHLLVKEVNKQDAKKMMSFDLGALGYATTLKAGDTRHISLCGNDYDIPVQSFSLDPKTVQIKVNGEDFVLAAAEARRLKSGKTLSILSIDAKQDRWGSVSFEIA